MGLQRTVASVGQSSLYLKKANTGYDQSWFKCEFFFFNWCIL